MSPIYSPIAGNASVYQLDHEQLSQLVMPELQDMADNQPLLEQHLDRRFNRDDPPPYRSPSADEDDDDQDIYEHLGFDLLHPLQSLTAQDRAKIDNLIGEPLTETELIKAQRYFESSQPAYNPGRLYDKAAKDATLRAMMPSYDGCPLEVRKSYNGRAGRQRLNVLIRHGIKKRWQSLGVWNPEWGIPGRVDSKPRDESFRWRWTWQGDTQERGATLGFDHHVAQHPNSRAIRLRQGLRRGEASCVPPPPRHRLEPDASQSTAESFITSRPWYIYGLEQAEESVRLRRLSGRARRLYDEDHGVYVQTRWEESGEFDIREKAGRDDAGLAGSGATNPRRRNHRA
ncbi:hypothetical protein G6O67_001031 [Ophiocordyceps sinensis]|uniref:Uncharacterized protein n=1 Tax=Ophiocordyceps sinensis TaxID=72228 RepID=A0A8H4PWP3_9HYPO|nr:hypothetical protein G6O67_001031 [Ophiocordyceps sinensis]